jgi:predicted GIY-YIG superfamily endonuclease
VSKAEFAQIVGRMEDIYGELMDCELVKVTDRRDVKNCPGIYVFFDGDMPIYVGRTRKLKQRVGQHISGNQNQSSLAFRYARSVTKRKATYRKNGSREALMKDDDFRPVFDEFISRLKQMQFRYVIVEDAATQHIFEIYAALRLQTPMNSFETH